MTDDQTIRSVLDRYARAIHDKDAKAMVSFYSDDVVAFDLEPPLAQGHEKASDISAIESWFATWEGPIATSERDFNLKAGGDIAYARALRRMTGKKRDGEEVDVWFRSTVGLERRGGQWQITHLHSSVPMAMDGSDKALVDLKP